MATTKKVVVELEIRPARNTALQSAFRSIDTDLSRMNNKGGGGGGGGIGSALGALVGGGGGGGGGMLGGIGGALGGAAGVLGGAALAIGGVTAGVLALEKATEAFVAKSNPAALKQLNLAVDDLMAVIGRALLPVVEFATRAFRFLGDVLAVILPSADDLRDVFSVFDDVLREMYDLMATIAPVIKDVLVGALKALAVALRFLLAPLFYVLDVLKRFGLIKEGAGASIKGASFGAAAQPAAFSSVEDYARKVYTSFLSSGGNPQLTEAQKQTKLLQDIARNTGAKDSSYSGEGGDFDDAHKRGIDGSIR